jgi:hypothetical protein
MQAGRGRALHPGSDPILLGCDGLPAPGLLSHRGDGRPIPPESVSSEADLEYGRDRLESRIGAESRSPGSPVVERGRLDLSHSETRSQAGSSYPGAGGAGEPGATALGSSPLAMVESGLPAPRPNGSCWSGMLAPGRLGAICSIRAGSRMARAGTLAILNVSGPGLALGGRSGEDRSHQRPLSGRYHPRRRVSIIEGATGRDELAWKLGPSSASLDLQLTGDWIPWREPGWFPWPDGRAGLRASGFLSEERGLTRAIANRVGLRVDLGKSGVASES